MKIGHSLPTVRVRGDLTGIELIWNVALRAEEEHVGKEAIVLLVHLYMSVGIGDIR
jgi:hypothetical protein